MGIWWELALFVLILSTIMHLLTHFRFELHLLDV